jgi:hypothetical protein
MPLAGAVVSLLTTGVFANPNARGSLMSSATFLALIEFGWLGPDHPHMVGVTCFAGSTFVPRTALTCACVSREHGSVPVPRAYAGWELQSIKPKIVPVIAPNTSFEFNLSPPGNWLRADFVAWPAPW